MASSETVAKKGSEKSSEKILMLLVEDPSLSAKDLTEAVGMSSRAVRKTARNIEKQKKWFKKSPMKKS